MVTLYQRIRDGWKHQTITVTLRLHVSFVVRVNNAVIPQSGITIAICCLREKRKSTTVYCLMYTYVRVAVSNTDCDNPSKEVEVATPGMVKQPLHVTLWERKTTAKLFNALLFSIICNLAMGLVMRRSICPWRHTCTYVPLIFSIVDHL